MKTKKAIDLHVLIEKEGDLYSALCLELNVASQGRTLAEAKELKRTLLRASKGGWRVREAVYAS